MVCLGKDTLSLTDPILEWNKITGSPSPSVVLLIVLHVDKE